MSCGIYKITNTIDGKCYIGQSIHIEYRWIQHCSSNYDSVIHRAIEKYGKSNFTFQILEECNKESLDEREQYWIKKYNSIVPNGYNVLSGGHPGIRDFHKIEKEVHQYDLYGQLIAKYPSCSAAALKVNTRPANIAACCRHEVCTTSNYQWRYADDQDLRLITNGLGIRNRSVTQYSMDGIKIKDFDTIKEAANELKCSQSVICAACNGRQYSAAGFRWAYTNALPCEKRKKKQIKSSEHKNNKRVGQYNSHGELLKIFPSITIAAEETGANASCIGAVCKGKRKTSGGYVWRYISD